MNRSARPGEFTGRARPRRAMHIFRSMTSHLSRHFISGFTLVRLHGLQLIGSEFLRNAHQPCPHQPRRMGVSTIKAAKIGRAGITSQGDLRTKAISALRRLQKMPHWCAGSSRVRTWPTSPHRPHIFARLSNRRSMWWFENSDLPLQEAERAEDLNASCAVTRTLGTEIFMPSYPLMPILQLH